jgi:hypothetical protein
MDLSIVVNGITFPNPFLLGSARRERTRVSSPSRTTPAGVARSRKPSAWNRRR